MARRLKVTIWNENRHERQDEKVAAVYPDGIHGALAAGLAADDLEIRTATLDDPDHGLGGDRLQDTDVLVWWGHLAHDAVDDAVADRVQARVLAGMGLVVLHSGHHSKPFKRLMGTNCNLVWREQAGGERERLWVVDPAHPIAAGVADCTVIPAHEMYGEPFAVPAPDELVFISWFEGGEVFRSGCTWRRGRGRVFYFSPGHETFPVYYDPAILTIIANGVRWAAEPHRHGHDLSVVNRTEAPEG